MSLRPVLHTTKPRVPNGTIVRDIMSSALTELFFIEHPHIPKGTHDAKALHTFVQKHTQKNVWVYYPWRNMLMRIPNEELYVRLRTARNRNLITPEEQKKYRAASVGIAGLSVGSAALATLVATGGPKHIRLADPDIVEITNLNRIRATLLDVGENKVVVAARAAFEVDPFLAITCLEEGIQQETLQAFVTAKQKLHVFVDEMDNIEMKFLCREMCKKLKVPVVMATDNGDGAILDIERFDEEPDRPIFHGRVHIAPEERKNMSRAQFIKMANDIIDPALFTTRQQQSIMEIGKSLSGVPQLGSAATLAGVAVAYAVRAIVTGQKLPSGRYRMSCEQAFIPGYDSKKEQKQRAAHTKKFIAAFSPKKS